MTFGLMRAAQLGCIVLVLAGCADGLSLPGGAGQSPASETEQVAKAAYSVGDFTESARLYERAAEREPRSVPALLGLGRSYIALGQYARAENALVRARELSSRNPEVLVELGNLSLYRMQPRPALAHFDAALKADGRNLSAMTGKAIALDYQSRHAEAQEVYRSALRHYPTNFPLMNNYALSLVLSGEIGRGIAMMEELLRDPERGDTVRTNMAIAYALEGRRRDARTMLEGVMSRAEIDAALAHYDSIRTDYLAGKPVGHLIFL